MLTGKSPFSGATTSDIVAKVLERDPDWTSLPKALPEGMHRVLRWALVKDVHRRLRHIGDAILELEASAPPVHHVTTHKLRGAGGHWPPGW